MTTDRGEVVGPTVGQTPFGVGPDGLVGIELRGVGRNGFEMESRESTADFPNRLSFVNAGVVPDDEDVTPKMAQQVPEEFADLVVSDVLRVALEVQADALTPGSDREARDHGDAIVPVAMMNEGGLTARRPGLSHRGDQEEARLVGEDDVGTQPRRVFLHEANPCASSDRSSLRRAPRRDAPASDSSSPTAREAEPRDCGGSGRGTRVESVAPPDRRSTDRCGVHGPWVPSGEVLRAASSAPPKASEDDPGTLLPHTRRRPVPPACHAIA